MSSGEGLANNNKTPYFTRFFYLGVDIFVDPPKCSSTVKLFKPAAGAAIFTFSTKKTSVIGLNRLTNELTLTQSKIEGSVSSLVT